MSTLLETAARHVLSLPARSAGTARFLAAKNPLVLSWPVKGAVAANWGDKLNPWLARRLTGREVFHPSEFYPVAQSSLYYWIGSHLAAACANPRAEVWGSGFIREDDPVKGGASVIHAVRGWKSARKLAAAGFAAPKVVGDAALLLPRVLTPAKPAKRNAIGLIPHFRDRDAPFFRRAREWDDVLHIDIMGGIEEVVDQIVSCDRIVSSSLHGIICADAYGIPAYWVEASENVLGDGFKFNDYFSSVGRPEQEPLPVGPSTSRQQVEDAMYDYRIDIDLDALWNACPVEITWKPEQAQQRSAT